MYNQEKLWYFDEEMVETMIGKIDIPNRLIRFQKSPGSIPSELPQNLKDFYKEIEIFSLEWEAREVMYNEDAHVVGSITINNWEVMWQDWDQVFYPENKRANRVDDSFVNFKVIGYVHEGSFFGYYHDGTGKDDILFMDDATMELMHLGLNFNGFMEMMIAARSIAHWPKVILFLKGNQFFEYAADEFKTYMPQLFPNFSWEDFVAQYERVRIN